MIEDSSRAWKDQYMLRFPDGLRDRLKAEAAKSKRSLNAEIIDRLEYSFELGPHLDRADREMAELKQEVAELAAFLKENLKKP